MPTGISIHVGLNELNEKHYNGRFPLSGCLADAQAMHDLAGDAGFEPRLITAEAATTQAVKNAIADACPRVGSDGMLLLTFSGHGSRVKDLAEHGRLVDRHDVGDGWDESWCLYDRQLVDDELFACWADFPRGVRILVVSDSCLSAGMIRSGSRAPALAPATATGSGTGAESEGPGPELKVGNPKPKWDPLELEKGPAAVKAAPVTRSLGPRRRALAPAVSRRVYFRNFSIYDNVQRDIHKHPPRPVAAEVMLLAASEDNQAARDGEHNGAFTAALLEVWNGGKFQGDYRVLHDQIRQRLLGVQTPRLLALRRPAFADQRPFTI